MLSVTRIVRIASRVAEWATPHIKEWHRVRHLNRNEAQRHFQARNWSEAEKHFQLALAETHHSTVDRLALLLGLVEAQRLQSKLDEAENTAGDAVKIAVREENETLHALALDSLANVQLDQERYADAEKTAREVIRLETARSKPDHTRLASCSSKLATALERSDRPAEAIEALKNAVSHAEKSFGGEHPETAAHLSDLGALHRRHGHHEAAQNCLRRALGIHRALGMKSDAGGADSPEATEALYNLAASLEESGDLDGAAKEFERMLALRERQLGANPGDTAAVQVRLAGLQLSLGRVSTARELLIQALPSLERKGGPMLAEALEGLAVAEDLSGRGDQGRQYREKAQVAAAIHLASSRQ